MKTRKYMVVSYDTDEQQPFWDPILATGPEQAKAYVGAIRDYALVIDALDCDDLRRVDLAIVGATPTEVFASMRQLKKQHSRF